VQRAGWLAAYEDVIGRAVIDQAMGPDDGARVRQTFQTRPWQHVVVAVAQEEAGEAAAGIVGYASFGPEVDVLGAPWPHPPTAAGEKGEVGELYALYVHPAWWSTGTGRALMDRVLAETARAGYPCITLWVLRDNARARRFYDRAGFAPDGASNILHRLGGVTEIRYRRPPSPQPNDSLLLRPPWPAPQARCASAACPAGPAAPVRTITAQKFDPC
jgi:GNAT superfamily N-acetyltransferase